MNKPLREPGYLLDQLHQKALTSPHRLQTVEEFKFVWKKVFFMKGKHDEFWQLIFFSPIVFRFVFDWQRQKKLSQILVFYIKYHVRKTKSRLKTTPNV